MVRAAFCDSDAEAKIGALLAIMVISVVSVGVVCCYALCYIRRRRMICQQRLYEASERENIAFQDVNILLTYMAYLKNRGVSLEPPPPPVGSMAKSDSPADRRLLTTDPTLDALRKQILQRVVVFYGYEKDVGPQPSSDQSGGSLKQAKSKMEALPKKSVGKKTTISAKAPPVQQV